MKLQIWAEVDLPDPDEDESVNDYVRLFQDDYPSLAGLAKDYIDGDALVEQNAKVIVTLERRRVVLQLHPRLVCPDCRNEMQKAQVGPFLFVCICGHREGKVEQ